MIIYQLVNRITGMSYIGQTRDKTVTRRLRAHCKSDGRTYICRAIQKYGFENFEVKILAHAKTFEELDQLEEKFITELGTLSPNGYNLTTGGEHPVYSEESRKKLTEMNLRAWKTRARKYPPEVGRQRSAALKGRVFSDAHRKALSENAKRREQRNREARISL